MADKQKADRTTERRLRKTFVGICVLVFVLTASTPAPGGQRLHTVFKLVATQNGSTTTFDQGKIVQIPMLPSFPWSCMTMRVGTSKNGSLAAGFVCFQGGLPDTKRPTLIVRANCFPDRPDSGMAMTQLGANFDEANSDKSLLLVALCTTE
jgi:hypothetical protein